MTAHDPTPGMLSAEGRDDLDDLGDLDGRGHGAPSERPEAPLPGATRQLRDIADDPADDERRDRLADRVRVGMPSPAGGAESDVLPDLDVPEGRM